MLGAGLGGRGSKLPCGEVSDELEDRLGVNPVPLNPGCAGQSPGSQGSTMTHLGAGRWGQGIDIFLRHPVWF